MTVILVNILSVPLLECTFFSNNDLIIILIGIWRKSPWGQSWGLKINVFLYWSHNWLYKKATIKLIDWQPNSWKENNFTTRCLLKIIVANQNAGFAKSLIPPCGMFYNVWLFSLVDLNSSWHNLVWTTYTSLIFAPLDN